MSLMSRDGDANIISSPSLLRYSVVIVFAGVTGFDFVAGLFPLQGFL